MTELKTQRRCNSTISHRQNTWQINSCHRVCYEEHTFLKQIIAWLQGPISEGKAKHRLKSILGMGKRKNRITATRGWKSYWDWGLAFCRKRALYHFVGKCSCVIQLWRNTLGVETDFCNLWETRSLSLCCWWWGALQSCFPSKIIEAEEAEHINVIRS